MTEFFRNWVLNIVTAIVFIVFVEIIISSDKFKKYVKLATGLVLMIIIINPIVTLVNKDFSLDSLAVQSFNSFDQRDLESQTKRLDEMQAVQVVNVYKQKLEQQIKDQILSFKEVSDADVEVEIEEDIKSKTFGTVLQINAKLKVNQSRTKGEIQKVDINSSQNELPEELKNRVKDKLLNIYGLSNEKINIT